MKKTNKFKIIVLLVLINIVLLALNSISIAASWEKAQTNTARKNGNYYYYGAVYNKKMSKTAPHIVTNFGKVLGFPDEVPFKTFSERINATTGKSRGGARQNKRSYNWKRD